MKFYFSKIANRNLYVETLLVFTVNVLTVFINMFTASMIAKFLTVEDMGIYSLMLTGMGIFTFATLPGMDVVINKAVLIGREGAIIPAMKRSLFMAALFSLGGFVVGLLNLKYAFFAYPELIFLLALMILVLCLQKYESLLLGRRKFKESRLIALAMAISLMCSSVFFSVKFESIYAVIFGMIIIRCLFFIFGWVIAKRGVHLNEPLEKKELNQLMKQGKSISLLAVFNLGIGYLDRLILASISIESLAFYHVAALVPTRLKEQLKMLLGVPIQTWSAKGLKFYLKKVQQYFTLLACSAFIFCSLLAYSANVYIPLLFGDKYLLSLVVASILSYSIFFRILTTFLEQINTIFSDSIFYQKVVYLKQGIYILILPVFLYFWGSAGVAFALVVCDMINFIFHYYNYKSVAKGLLYE